MIDSKQFWRAFMTGMGSVLDMFPSGPMSVRRMRKLISPKRSKPMRWGDIGNSRSTTRSGGPGFFED